MSLWTQHETRLEELRQSIPGGPSGWAPQRLVYRDWWHWRDGELGFAHGRLALTGQNAGGKSSLLALAIPMLLDGDTSSIRLDPAQSRDRHLVWYLLGEDDADAVGDDTFRYEARTGYLALEFRHAGSGEYLTIGMGVSASRRSSRPLRAWWGFVLPKVRLGRDFDVRGPGERCLEHREFVLTVPEGTIVTTERGEYRREVNKVLFGMSDDDYQALISMLLQARRPKLGEQSGPERVCSLLRDALPGVPGEQLDRVAEVVDNIEQHQRNLDDVRRRADRLAEVDDNLHALAEVLVQDAARQYSETSGRLGNLSGRLKTARSLLADASAELEQLAARAAERNKRLAEIAAQLEVFHRDDKASLPARVAESRQRHDQASHRRQQLAARVDEQKARWQSHQTELARIETRFRDKAAAAAGGLRQLAVAAEQACWLECARECSRAAADVSGLLVTSTLREVDLTRPDGSLESCGEQLSQAYGVVVAAREKLDEATAELQRRRQELVVLEARRETLIDRESQAHDEAEERKSDLVRSLEEWRAGNSAFTIPDHVMGELMGRIWELDVADVAADPRSLTDSLRQHAANERERMARRQPELFREEARAQAETAQIEQHLCDLRRDGVEPTRSALRAAARKEAAGAGLKPLFAHVRFRAGVDEAVAARVEAAALEAGFLDLLLVAPGSEVPMAAGDAWFVPPGPTPHDTVSTLLDILEPEPEAPAWVASVLGAVRFGTASGERWITPDGHWRHGVARGRVTPWLTEAAGLVGQERRVATLEARLEALGQVKARAIAQQESAREEREALEGRLTAIGAQLEALAGAPWQPVIMALNQVGERRAQVADVNQEVAEAQSLVDLARATQARQEAAYRSTLADCPAATGLDRHGLDNRREALDRMVYMLRTRREDWRSLSDLVDNFAQQTGQLEQDRRALETTRADLAQADEQLAVALSSRSALEEQARDPEVSAIGAKIESLMAEKGSLSQEGESDSRLRDDLIGQQASSESTIDELEPQESEHRGRQARLHDRLRQRLLLHPRLAEMAGALERESPVAVVPRLPRPVEPETIEQEANARRARLQECLHRNQDTLGDYRPTPDEVWETVTFHYEGKLFTASDLHGKLLALADDYRGLIAQKEQELYQKIILHGILEELRRLIYQARLFTERTNGRLRGLSLSSREQLSLRLHIKNEDDVPGAGIARTLESLDQGSDYLPPERRDYLIQQVRAEIDRVRREAAARSEEISYLVSIQKALDYREWFEYQLLSLQPGRSAPTPVRNRGFGQRSTSAKAWALAVPVIAGVAARYSAGLSDAPRLIALDEAFAGFDTNNQVNYLKFLDGLSLSWIITSPDELAYSDNLSAAMAYRLSLEGNVHTAFPILWDGTRASEPISPAWADVASGVSLG